MNRQQKREEERIAELTKKVDEVIRIINRDPFPAVVMQRVMQRLYEGFYFRGWDGKMATKTAMKQMKQRGGFRGV